MPPVTPEAWLRLAELPESIFGPAASWAHAHAGDPARGWDECPRGDWLVAIAARAGVGARALIGAVAMTFSAISNELDRLGRPESRALRHAIELSEAWADGAAEAPELRAALDALGANTLGPDATLLFAAWDAAHHEALHASGEARVEQGAERAWARLSLAQHASSALRALAEPLGPRGGEATAEVLRSFLAWADVEASLAVDASL